MYLHIYIHKVNRKNEKQFLRRIEHNIHWEKLRINSYVNFIM